MQELDHKVLELILVVLSLWEITHKNDPQNILPPPIDQWIQLLQRIKNPLPTPLEELSQQGEKQQNQEAQQEEIEEDSSDEEQEQQEQEQDTIQPQQAQLSGRIQQREFDHPTSTGFNWRPNSGQQFRSGGRRGPYIKRGRWKTGGKHLQKLYHPIQTLLKLRQDSMQDFQIYVRKCSVHKT